MIKWAEDEVDRTMIYEYSQVMPDKAGEACGIWYKSLVIPNALNIKDPNQCLLFKKVPDTMVNICSTQSYRKFYAIRMIMKKYEAGC